MSSVLDISPLTRVEGHGRISVYLDGQRVEGVRLVLAESPRLFETLLLGKDYREVPEIICRICSICSTVHRVVSLLAIEKALDVGVSEQVRLYRELIVNGGHIQSHALHLYCLVLPDMLGVNGFAEMAAKAPEELQMGLRIKAVGNLIQETVGGRLIHPVTLIPGGMGKPVNKSKLLKIREALVDILPEAWKTYRLFKSAHKGGELPCPVFMAVRAEGSPTFFGERLFIGQDWSAPIEQYREILNEQAVASSNAKKTAIKGNPVTVGALARLNLGLSLSAKAQQALLESADQIMNRNILSNNLAQAIELVHTVEHSLEIVETLLASNFERVSLPRITPFRSSGSAAIEAPRGTLIHSYAFDDQGRCSGADIVTPTVINQAAMQDDLLALAQSMGGGDAQALAFALERLARTYDPCISCAVHLIRL